MIYMHHHMQDHPSLLNACVSFPPKDVASHSSIHGDRTRRTAEVGMAPGGRHGPGSRGKKAGSKSTSVRLALESIASKNNARAQFIVAKEQQLAMKPEKNLCDDVYNIKQKRRKTLHDFVAHCGDKELAKVHILDNVKAQELQENLANDLSIDNILDSQESCIVELLEHERTLETLKKLHAAAQTKINSFLSEKEN
jgi:hypothetical protein